MKKVLIMLLFVIMAIGVGVGLYFLFIHEPKEKVEKEEPKVEEPVLVELAEGDPLLKNLIYPEGSPIHREWKYIDIKISNMDRRDLMLLAAFGKADGTTSEEGMLISGMQIEDGFKKLFGPDIEYTNGNLREETEGIVCGAIDTYDAEKNVYLIVTNCDGNSDEYSLEKKFAKAEQLGDEIYVYFYVIEYVTKIADGHIYKIDVDGAEELVESVNAIKESVEDESSPMYKFTFKKQSDGNYYVSSGEWVK